MTTQPCAWTDAAYRLAVDLAWRCGYDYALGTAPVLEAIDEARWAPLTSGPPRTALERYMERMAEMEPFTAPVQYRGGPVNWDSHWTTVPAWLYFSATQQRLQDHSVMRRAWLKLSNDLDPDNA